MSKNLVNMGEGPVFPTLLRLGAPAMLSMFFEALYGLVDSIFVTRLGTIPLAAMSLTIPFLFLTISLSKGVSVGSLAVMSHARGSGDHAAAKKIAAAAFPLTLLALSLLILLALPAVNQRIFAIFDKTPELLQEVDHYSRWLGLSFPFIGFAMICEAIFFSYGDTKTPMKAMIAGNILNIILDPLLIFTCNMGVGGAALASLAGWALSGAIMFYALKQKGFDTPSLKFSQEQIQKWRQIIHLGTPIALSLLVIPVSGSIFNYLLANFGPVYVGAWNLSARIEWMVVLPIYGLSGALIPFIGFNLGSRRYDRIKEGCRAALYGCYAFIIPAIVLFWFQSDSLISIFKPSPELLKMAAFVLKIAALGYILLPFELIMTSLSQGLKQPRYSLIISALRLLLLKIPLALIFLNLWQGTGIFISHPVSLAISGIVSFIIMQHLLTNSMNPKETDNVNPA